MQNEAEIRARSEQLRGWARDLAGELQVRGVRTFPTETYFFLADFAPHDAGAIAAHLKRTIFWSNRWETRASAHARVIAALEEVL